MPTLSPGMQFFRDVFGPSNMDLSYLKGYFEAGRMIPVIGPLSEELLGPIAVVLLKLDIESGDPIRLFIRSEGGDINPCFEFFDVIKALRSPVDCIAFGKNASMAVDLLQMGRRRYILPGTRLLVHYARYKQVWIGDDPEYIGRDLEIYRQDVESTREKRFALYEHRTGLTREQLESHFRYGEVHHAYFSADVAIKFGYADEILTDFKFHGPSQKKEVE